MGSGSSRRRGAAGARAVPAGGAAAAENRQLLETVPAECEEAAALPAPAPAAGGIPSPRAGGEVAGGGGGTPPQQAVLSTKSLPGPENNTANHQCPESNSKKPAVQSTISYDYAEEELMASIEREYCR
ncbi:cystin-1 [Aegotheles albertisi]